mgnify:CR=1 FL=1
MKISLRPEYFSLRGNKTLRNNVNFWIFSEIEKFAKPWKKSFLKTFSWIKSSFWWKKTNLYVVIFCSTWTFSHNKISILKSQWLWHWSKTFQIQVLGNNNIIGYIFYLHKHIILHLQVDLLLLRSQYRPVSIARHNPKEFKHFHLLVKSFLPDLFWTSSSSKSMK